MYKEHGTEIRNPHRVLLYLRRNFYINKSDCHKRRVSDYRGRRHICKIVRPGGKPCIKPIAAAYIALTQRAGLKTEYRKRVLILTPSLFYLSARNVSFLNNKINAAIVIIIVNNPK